MNRCKNPLLLFACMWALVPVALSCNSSGGEAGAWDACEVYCAKAAKCLPGAEDDELLCVDACRYEKTGLAGDIEIDPNFFNCYTESDCRAFVACLEDAGAESECESDSDCDGDGG